MSLLCRLFKRFSTLAFFFKQRLIYSIKPCFSSVFSLVFPGSRMLLSARGFAGLVGWSDVSSKAYVRLIAGDGCGGEGVISDRNVWRWILREVAVLRRLVVPKSHRKGKQLTLVVTELIYNIVCINTVFRKHWLEENHGWKWRLGTS